MSTATQMTLGSEARSLTAAQERVAELERELEDERVASQRQADINLELMSQIAQVCDGCREIIEGAIADLEAAAT